MAAAGGDCILRVLGCYTGVTLPENTWEAEGGPGGNWPSGLKQEWPVLCEGPGGQCWGGLSTMAPVRLYFRTRQEVTEAPAEA